MFEIKKIYVLRVIIPLGMCCLLLLFLCSSCGKGQNYLEDALRLAGDNRPELEKVLAHYRQNPEDSLKYRAAVFLIENMPGHYSVDYPEMDNYFEQVKSIFAYDNKTKKQADSLISLITVNYQQMKAVYDIQAISASYLIDQIDLAFETRNYPWAKSIPWEDFCEYVLPYRSANEPFEDWRLLYKQRMANVLDSLISVQASDSLVCATFMSFFKSEAFVGIINSFPVPLKPSLYLEMNTGSCNDLTLFTQYVIRTAGLPVTYDFTPQWANRLYGHEWNALISNGEAVSFQINDQVPFAEHLLYKANDKLAKAYRKMFSLQKESLPMQKPKEEIPPLFRSPLMQDVSEYYFKPTDIQVDLIYPPPVAKQYAYMMVFNNREWRPVAWGRIRNNRVTFPKMSTGCVYLVMYYDKGNYYTASDLFCLDNDGNKKIIIPHPTNKESVTLIRKYPFYNHSYVLAERMPGGKFQVANRADFKDAITVHEIDTLENLTFQYVRLDSIPACKYFRYLSSGKGHVFLAEMSVYGTEGRKLTGKIIGTDGSRENNGRVKSNVFDGNNLTYFDAPSASGGWVGLEFDQKEQIQVIKYLPRNDDNHINENEEYELFYYDHDWISLGKRTGDQTHVLKYDNVPENALLWLRNHTKGEEERIFMYENGKQVWW